MLVLSRRNQEQIVLPGLGITITILETKNNKVSIGIDADRHFIVLRFQNRDRDTKAGQDNLFLISSRKYKHRKLHLD